MKSAARSSFLKDLFAQLASDVLRIDAGRWCAHNAFIGTILIGGAFALRFSGPPVPLGPRGFALVLGAGIALFVAAIVPLFRRALVPAVLAADGLVVIALTAIFAVACVSWTGETAPRRSFRYLPGFITTAATYGGALWADFGLSRAHPRRWRLAGVVLGVALDAVVGVQVIGAVLRD